VTLKNLALIDLASKSPALDDTGPELTLDNVAVENQSPTGANGIEVRKPGSLTFTGGKVVMENGAFGFGVFAEEGALAITGVTIDVGLASPAEAGGLDASNTSLSISDSNVNIESGESEETTAIEASEDTSVSLQDDTVRQGGLADGVVADGSPMNADGLTVEMRNAANPRQAIAISESEPGSVLDHLNVGGSWVGSGIDAGGNVTIADSTITANTAGTAPALVYGNPHETTGLLVRRSVLEAASNADPGALFATSGNVTVEASEIFGGASGVTFVSSEGVRRLTIADSTIGARPGFGFGAPGLTGVDVTSNGSNSSALVAIEGSILFGSQFANAPAGDHAGITCTYSSVPSQIQAADETAGKGEIGCGAGTAGNTNWSTESGSLFAEPLHSYVLSPSSSAIDSVPVSAITLPFGLTPSSTDLAGNPRSDRVDCVALQDKGALELPGRFSPCPAGPPPPGAKPLAGVITALTIYPGAFVAAPRGATISKTTKKRYGAKITYRDTQRAMTNFTVLRPSPGRMQGSSCRKPSGRNRRGRRCTILRKLGSFVHDDRAAINSLHFSGRIKGRKLPPGSYLLRAVARDAAGYGGTVSKRFRVR
jgi:hypothetical protein